MDLKDEPLTEDMLQELMLLDDPSLFIDGNGVSERNLPGILNRYLEQKGMRRVDVIHAAQLNETFGYQIFTGARRPSRNKVLQIAFAMGLDLTEANRVLQAAEASPLYCKDRRDVIIIFCINKGRSLSETNETLYSFGEDTIC